LLYWPDIRGATVKQASAAIATGDESVLSPDSIAQKSIALQGFGTLEYLLYGTPADTIATPDGSFACRFALAVSRNIATVAGEASAGWAEGAEFPRLLANPAPDNPLARTHKEAAERLLSLLPDSLETARDQRILPALGDSAKDSKVRRAPFWRSGLTLKVIAANLSGVVEAVKVSDIDDALPEDARFLVSNATFGLENVISVLDGLDGGFEAALKDPEGRDKLTYVTVAIREAREEIGPKLFQALDLTAGFNASDGD
ncbi:MAG: hypothetical protein KDJ77_12135, partial [Rhodobiaceae bacterium]|nr:hypothetical protein [Rhodobiaceae bacterium]